MKVNVHAVNFNIDAKLVSFIQERMDRLEKYYDKIVSADVFLKVENISEKENKIAEIKVPACPIPTQKTNVMIIVPHAIG